MSNSHYEVLQPLHGVPVKAWTHGVPFDEKAKQQLYNMASLPFIHKWVAVMPDVHYGLGATIGSVVPTYGAIIPAAVGVDIGCGMMAVRTSLKASTLPDNLSEMRHAIEKAVPHGRTHRGRKNDRGAWSNYPDSTTRAWKTLEKDFEKIAEKHPVVRSSNHINHLGTLGTGNHFIEVCLDENDRVWLMLHSGSRGVGNCIGHYFIEKAKEEMQRLVVHLPDTNLAYFSEGSVHFEDYVEAVGWAQRFAFKNREVMMENVIKAVQSCQGIPEFDATLEVVNCHHNYVAKEYHFDQDVWVTRKGAVRARNGELGIIPGSMGARSYIVRGLGNPNSFHSCSHGAGRIMSRTEAKKQFTVTDHQTATAGVECRKDAKVVDETPGAYKSIDAVMAAQKDLVEVVYTLKQVVCVKG